MRTIKLFSLTLILSLIIFSLVMYPKKSENKCYHTLKEELESLKQIRADKASAFYQCKETLGAIENEIKANQDKRKELIAYRIYYINKSGLIKLVSELNRLKSNFYELERRKVEVIGEGKRLIEDAKALDKIIANKTLATFSDPFRDLIPIESGHQFRFNATGDSEHSGYPQKGDISNAG